MTKFEIKRYAQVIDEICALQWTSLSREQLFSVAMAYYYFSIQFRENLEVACELFPGDEQLSLLREGECETSNLSPFPGIAASGERMNHDEFMRRVVERAGLDADEMDRLDQLGTNYLAAARHASRVVRAQSIASYEDGGLERVFTAILTAPNWAHPALQAFHHFLTEHIKFDSDPDVGHGALARHLVPDDRILPLWVAFRDLLTVATPALQPVTPLPKGMKLPMPAAVAALVGAGVSV